MEREKQSASRTADRDLVLSSIVNAPRELERLSQHLSKMSLKERV